MKRGFIIVAAMMMTAVLAACGQKASSAPTTAGGEAPATSAAGGAASAPSAAGETATAPSAAGEAVWPTETVQLIVPAKAGGDTDVIARIYGAALEKKLGAPVVIVNQTEGNGIVAYDQVHDAKADGHTLLFHLLTILAQEHTGVYDCDVINEFSVIGAFTGDSGYAMVVRADSEFDSAKQVAAYIAEHPGEMTFACQLGGTSHLMPAAFAKAAGGDFKYVDAGGDADRRTALLGGNVDITLQSCTSVGQYIESGDMKCLGVWTAEGRRDPAAPELPTFTELGFDVTWPSTYVCLGPKDMDPVLAEAVNAAFKAVMEDPEVKEQAETAGFHLTHNSVEDARAFIEKQDEYIKSICSYLGF